MKLRPFELVLVVIFGVLIIISLLLLNGYTPEPDEEVSNLGDKVSIWGTLPPEVVNSVLTKISQQDKGFTAVSYRYIPPENFDSVFVNALADQQSPDLLLLPHDRLVQHRTRLQAIAYESLPLRDFRNFYIDGAAVFALSDGIYGFPVAVDPLVMYWNRDIFANNGFVLPPKTWEEVVSNFIPSLTMRDANRNITQAGIAMGEYRNVKNAFPIISTLLLQGGSQMVTENQNQYQILLNQVPNQPSSKPFHNAATFFTNFSNPVNTLYSWNQSLPLDQDMFLSEDLAIYFGLASEAKELASKNPNLSFDIAEIPQGAGTTEKRTYGTYYGLVIPKAATNKAGSLAAMQILGSQGYAKELSDGSGMAPTYRAALAEGSNDVYGRIAYASAVYARGWLNPDLKQVGDIFTQMVDSINADRSFIDSAVNDALDKIRRIY